MKTKLTILSFITVGALAIALADEHTDKGHVTGTLSGVTFQHALIDTSTPCGTVIGIFPTRDISFSPP